MALVSTHPATPASTDLIITIPAGYDFFELRYTLDTTGNLTVKVDDGSGYSFSSGNLEHSGVIVVGELDHFPQATDLGKVTEALSTSGNATTPANQRVTAVKLTTSSTFIAGKAWLYGIAS